MTVPHSPLDDPDDTGLANERTALAGQRTALSLLAGAAILARLTWDDLGAVAVAPLAATFLLGTWVFWEARWRHAHSAGTRLRRRGRGGRAPLTLTLATLLLGAAELLALVA